MDTPPELKRRTLDVRRWDCPPPAGTGPAPASVEDPFGAIGRVVGGRYAIRRLVARGGMASIYEAIDGHDGGDGRRVAVKVFFASAYGDRREAAPRIAREVRIGRLGLAGVPRVLDYLDATDGLPPIAVLEYIDGETLETRLHRRRAGVRELLVIALGLTFPLAAAHAHGIVHRDITPANILVGRDGAVWLLDFGIAWVRDEPPLTGPNGLLGTMAYLAPEQLGGTALPDARTDVYQLGAVLHHALALAPLVDDALMPAAALEHLAAREQDPAADIQALVPGLPGDVAALLRKATAPGPERRFATMAGMREAIAACLGPAAGWPKLAATGDAEEAPVAKPDADRVGRIERAVERGMGRRRGIAAVAAAVAVTVGAGAIVRQRMGDGEGGGGVDAGVGRPSVVMCGEAGRADPSAVTGCALGRRPAAIASGPGLSPPARATDPPIESGPRRPARAGRIPASRRPPPPIDARPIAPVPPAAGYKGEKG